MPQSLAKIYVFSTKDRRGFLQGEDIRKEMHAYMASILKAYDSPARIIGGTADHVHILCDLSRTQTLAKIIGETKRSSSKWIKTKGPQFAPFQWQNGYGAFSVSVSKVPQVVEYIVSQDAHHRTPTFQDEFRAFLTRHEVEFDERYVWD